MELREEAKWKREPREDSQGSARPFKRKAKDHPVKLGLLGVGTVGEVVLDLVLDGHLHKLGIAAEITKVFTRNPSQKKRYREMPELFTTHPEDITRDPDIDIVVEMLGAEHDDHLTLFKEWVLDALSHGKSVVTSNKALLVRYGHDIWAAARLYGREIRFEACVAGGIPIIRSLMQSLGAEEPQAIYGILNGTSNYILTEMAQRGRSYAEALQMAQSLGYAETNPAADVSGADAEAKLILLSSATFGLNLEPGRLYRRGIELVDAVDFLYAERRAGSGIKSVAVARRVDGAVEAFVTPVVVPQEHFLSHVDGVTNAIFVKGTLSGPSAEAVFGGAGRDWDYLFLGPGAGGGPTAVAVLGDVYELCRQDGGGRRLVPRGWSAPAELSLLAADDIRARFYVRFVVRDQSGIVGTICQNFGRQKINIAEVWQLEHSRSEIARLKQVLQLRQRNILPFAITLEKTTVRQLQTALTLIEREDFILASPLSLPIWG